MEACSGAHHWARLFQALGHAVKLMAPMAAMSRSLLNRDAHFSDRGRLFQADRGRRFSAIVDARRLRPSG
jgi:transposase